MDKTDFNCEKIIHFLDFCYQSTQENDLGGFLGAISKNIVFADSRADEALYEDMKKIVSENSNDCSIDFITIYLLSRFQDLYEFDFSKTIAWIKSLTPMQMKQILFP